MTKERAGAVAAVVCAMAVLPGCYVTSVNLPDAPQFVDERLVGAWLLVETDTLKCCFHFQRLKERSALRLVTIDDKSSQIFEFTTMRVGDRQLFAASMDLNDWSSSETNGQSRQYHLGHYVVNDGEAVLYLLDAKKVKELVSRGVLTGTVDSDGAVTLTGSPADLTRFLASPEADSESSADSLRLRRFAASPSR